MAEEKEDQELAAIKTVLGVLGALEPEARNNVIDYVFRRLKITAPSFAAPEHSAAPPPATREPAVSLTSADRITDLRSLREQKQPRTVNHMVAVLAYYLAHLAPEGDRRAYIVPDDIRKYFPQANFELPIGPPGQTLLNAKNAGYLDLSGKGQYRLNPVGHNLVTHKLSRGEGSAPSGGPRRARKTAKKLAKVPKVET
jgi:hypothetical protein